MLIKHRSTYLLGEEIRSISKFLKSDGFTRERVNYEQQILGIYHLLENVLSPKSVINNLTLAKWIV